jgi:very-short-patch-repair endonuclease
MTCEEAINEIAGAQDGLITRRQLLETGLSTDSIERRRRRGTLVAVHVGVYRVGPVAGPRARERAALLACGGGTISHASAAALLQIMPSYRTLHDIDVTLSQLTHARRREGVRAHRSALAADEITMIDGLPVTTPARTLLDLAAVSSQVLARCLAAADHYYPDSRDALSVLLARYPSSKGSRALRVLIQDPAIRSFTRSRAEDTLLALIHAGGIDKPETNVRVCGYEVDCYWRKAQLVVEVDGYEFHRSRDAFVRDRKRDSALTAAGIRVLRLSWHQLTKDRDRTLVQLALALAKATDG